MKIKITSNSVRNYEANQVVEVDDKTALWLIKVGKAEKILETPAIEKSVKTKNTTEGEK